MYEETRKAIKKTLNITLTLFKMDAKEYNRLLEVMKTIQYPDYIEDKEQAYLEFKRRYGDEAVKSGFTRVQGEALLEYSILLEELNVPQEWE